MISYSTFALFYLTVGALNATLIRKIENFKNGPLEERSTDFEIGVMMPLFWIFYLIRDVFFINFDNDGDAGAV